MTGGEIGEAGWIEAELAGSRFRDVRLGQRLRTLMTQMAGLVGAPIPLACQDWANTKAAYRFLSNQSVSEREILDGHFQATAPRFAGDRRAGARVAGHDRVRLPAHPARGDRVDRLLAKPTRGRWPVPAAPSAAS